MTAVGVLIDLVCWIRSGLIQMMEKNSHELVKVMIVLFVSNLRQTQQYTWVHFVQHSVLNGGSRYDIFVMADLHKNKFLVLVK